MSAKTGSEITPHDEVLYPCCAYPETHPDRLATLGLLFGLEAAPLDHCRVLEIGCGDGSNLIPMAFDLPQSEFRGVDLAVRPISQGNEFIRRLGLGNVSLSQMDLMDFSLASGPFDYVIAHGFYSWVPSPVRERLLAVCQGVLSPNGIALISYNCYPGGHVRTMLREMMLFHIQRAPDPAARIDQARALLQFLATARAQTDDYGQMLKKE